MWVRVSVAEVTSYYPQCKDRANLPGLEELGLAPTEGPLGSQMLEAERRPGLERLARDRLKLGLAERRPGSGRLMPAGFSDRGRVRLSDRY